MVNDELKNFINSNRDLINTKNWKDVFNKLPQSIDLRMQFMKLLLKADLYDNGTREWLLSVFLENYEKFLEPVENLNNFIITDDKEAAKMIWLIWPSSVLYYKERNKYYLFNPAINSSLAAERNWLPLDKLFAPTDFYNEGF